MKTFPKFRPMTRTVAVPVALLFAALGSGCGGIKTQAGPVFDSAGSAAQEFAEAVRAGDKVKLANMLGPESAPLLNPGDTVQGGNERLSFLQAYDSQRVLVPAGADTYYLEVGGGRWPLPLAIVKADGGWKFDTRSGIRELVLRRIGRNEIAVLGVMKGVVAAQQEYAAKFGAFATKLRSEPGKQDGLYWEAKEGEPQSPAGPLLAWAEAQGYTPGAADKPPAPYRGYFYRRLEVKDGAKEFAVIAYPAEYGASGIMTFIVNEKGEVYRKNLGTGTAQATQDIKTFAPDDTWTRES
jgi:hypothetical protein